ncbi:MAG: polyprenyl diphosphate synthase, partial [Candidatus Saccharibacteria bacterium]
MANTNSIPTHLGIILDGNRRWAKRNGLPTLQGHRQGMDNFKDVSLAAFGRGVKFVSAYIFSVENWQRTQEEVSYLMNLVNKGIQKHLETYHQAGIKLVMLGSRQGIEKKILASIDTAIEKTKANTKGTFVLCFNYGGKQEIAEAAQKLAKQGSEITFESLDQAIGLA